MSRTCPTDMDRLALQIPCSYCDAGYDEWCTTAAGRDPDVYAIWLHSSRTWPIYQAWSSGYEDHERSLASMSSDQLLKWHTHMAELKQRREQREVSP